MTTILRDMQASKEDKEKWKKAQKKKSNTKLYERKNLKGKPDGWTYDEENHEWVPQYLHNPKNASKIEENYFGEFDRFENLSDEEIIHVKQIQARKKEPTYEEWKAAKLAAEREKNQDQSAPAPGQNEPENCKE